MSLATRCPTCATAFRVVQDQLKVSGGWVRCGRCGEVFNATDGLYDLDDGADGAPAPSAPPGAALVRQVRPEWHVPGRPGTPAPATTPEPAAERAADPAPEPETIGQPLIESDGGVAAGTVDPTVDPSVPPAGEPSAWPADPRVPSPAPESEPAVATWRASRADEPADEADADDGPLPAFVQQAERAARWRRPWVRALLSLLLLGLGALLLAQVAYVQRDLLAARMPALAPTLAAWCMDLGCRIEPLRRIDRLTVESSGLARVEGSPLYRLSVVLRNRGDTVLKLPALELSITDASGELVARRVLTPAEAGATRDTLDAGQELALQPLLSVADRRLAGYTIELFYP